MKKFTVTAHSADCDKTIAVNDLDLAILLFNSDMDSKLFDDLSIMDNQTGEVLARFCEKDENPLYLSGYLHQHMLTGIIEMLSGGIQEEPTPTPTSDPMDELLQALFGGLN